MKKGDLAFFYQSNCKEPGIVGTMEIVREHTPDRKFPTFKVAVAARRFERLWI
jgi:predicted RNA-binding protein with PUA-like domain